MVVILFSEKLSLSFAIEEPPMERFIMFNKTELPENSDEAYHLQISSESIIITVQEAAGAFYAVESLISLWESGGGMVPTLTIADMPRYIVYCITLLISFFQKFKKEERPNNQIYTKN